MIFLLNQLFPDLSQIICCNTKPYISFKMVIAFIRAPAETTVFKFINIGLNSTVFSFPFFVPCSRFKDKFPNHQNNALISFSQIKRAIFRPKIPINKSLKTRITFQFASLNGLITGRVVSVHIKQYQYRAVFTSSPTVGLLSHWDYMLKTGY